MLHSNLSTCVDFSTPLDIFSFGSPKQIHGSWAHTGQGFPNTSVAVTSATPFSFGYVPVTGLLQSTLIVGPLTISGDIPSKSPYT